MWSTCSSRYGGPLEALNPDCASARVIDPATPRLAGREVVAADAGVPNQGDTEERLRVEGANDEHSSIVFLAGAVEFVSDVDAYRVPSDFARVIERALGSIADFLFVAVPAVEVFLHSVRVLYARCVVPQLYAMRSKSEGPRRGTRLGAQHESAATPQAADAHKTNPTSRAMRLSDFQNVCCTALREGCGWCSLCAAMDDNGVAQIAF